MKNSHDLTQKQIHHTITYLESQGWLEIKSDPYSFTTTGGRTVSNSTKFYQITASGIDKIEGKGEFTPNSIHGIKINATGPNNVISIGDGNKVNVKFGELGSLINELKTKIADSKLKESEKIDLAVDVDTIQSQLAKPNPNSTIVSTLWTGIQKRSKDFGENLLNSISKAFVGMNLI